MNMIPSYEAKLFLNSELVLNEENKLKDEVREMFAMPTTVTKLRVAYLDTEGNQVFNNEGWTVRVRKKEGNSKTEFTFKKRYPINGEDVDSQLTTGASEGFNSNQSVFEAEVDRGYAKQTLSFSYDKKVSISGLTEMEIPSLEKCISNAIKIMPDIFKNWKDSDWSNNTLTSSKKYGDVKAKRYIGYDSDETEITIEIWEILKEDKSGYEYVVELSIKTEDKEFAISKQEELKVLLESKGILLPLDKLKTQMILERY